MKNPDNEFEPTNEQDDFNLTDDDIEFWDQQITEQMRAVQLEANDGSQALADTVRKHYIRRIEAAGSVEQTEAYAQTAGQIIHLILRETSVRDHRAVFAAQFNRDRELDRFKDR